MPKAPGPRRTCGANMRPTPSDLTRLTPRLSWEVNDSRRGATQTAYQIAVAPTEAAAAAGEGRLWDSGRVISGQSIHVPYGGPALHAGERCYWSVRTWDNADAPSPWAEPAFWEMGLFSAADWNAAWITIEEAKAGPESVWRLDLASR